MTIKPHKCLPGEIQRPCFCCMSLVEMTEVIQDVRGPQPVTFITEEGGRGGDPWGDPIIQSVASTGSFMSWWGLGSTVSPSLYAEALTPSGMLLGHKDFGRALWLEEFARMGPSWWDSCPPRKRHQRASSFSLSTTQGHCQKVATGKPGRALPPEPDPIPIPIPIPIAGTLTSDPSLQDCEE